MNFSGLILLFIIVSLSQALYNILTGKKLQVLCCGLFGYSGSVAGDMMKISILGIINETRGRDSCGMVINDHPYWGTGKESDYRDFMAEQNLAYTSNTDNYTIIGHTRKGTSGGYTKSNAHPFFISSYEDKDKLWLSVNNMTAYESMQKRVEENKGVYLFGAHNGVLHNHYKLRASRGLPAGQFDLDSKILLGSMLMDRDFSILKDYEGKAALSFYKYGEKNTIYLYRGGSGTVEERPLFYWRVKNESGHYVGIYWSSIKESLEIISEGRGTIEELKFNTVYKIVDGKFNTNVPINRNPKKDTAGSQNHKSNHSQCNTDKGSCSQKSTQRSNKDEKSTVERLPSGKVNTEDLLDNTEIFRGLEVPDVLRNKQDDVINYVMGRFWLKGKLADGELNITDDGKVVSKDSATGTTYWFIRGIMLTSKTALGKILKKLNKNRKLRINIDSTLFKWPVFRLLAEHDIFEYTEASKLANSSFVGGKEANGSYEMPFGYETYNYKDGFLTSIGLDTKEEIDVDELNIEKVVNMETEEANASQVDLDNMVDSFEEDYEEIESSVVQVLEDYKELEQTLDVHDALLDKIYKLSVANAIFSEPDAHKVLALQIEENLNN